MSRPYACPATLYSVAVNEKEGARFSGLIVTVKDIDAMSDMSVPADQVGAVFQHHRPQADTYGLKYSRKPNNDTTQIVLDQLRRPYSAKSA